MSISQLMCRPDLTGFKRIDNGELLPRNQKDLKGFKTLKEIKLNDTRMLVQQGDPDKIVAIFMRSELKDVSLKLKDIYK